jgi:two-component system, sensor histidine kinase and response regulator
MAVAMRNRTTAEKYAVAVVAVGAAFALRYGLYGTLENRIPFAFFTLSTLIAAWYGGLGPGLLGAVGGLLLGDFFFLPPHSTEGGIGETERTAIGIYAMTSTLIVVLFWHLHSKLREAQDALLKAQVGKNENGAAGAHPHPGTPGQMRPL